MRSVILGAGLATACAMGDPAAGSGSVVGLDCPVAAPATVQALCQAIEAELSRGGYEVAAGQGVALRLILDAEAPRPSLLRARLIVEDRNGRREGKAIELSAADRPAVSRRATEDLARLLLQNAGLSAHP